MFVIIAWAKFFAPKAPPTSPQTNNPAASSPATAGQPAQPTTGNRAPSETSMAAAATPPVAAKSATQERNIVVENDLYRVEFSNRGGVVKSWQLKKYMDDAKPRQMLDLVHPKTAQEVDGWPLSIALDDQNLENTANSALYVSSASGNLTAPANLTFTWSDGHLEITKHFHFEKDYVSKAEVSARLDGKPLTAGLAWLG